MAIVSADEMKELESILAVTRAEGPVDLFCPLICGPCNRDCVCIGSPYIREHETSAIIIDWRCENPMLDRDHGADVVHELRDLTGQLRDVAEILNARLGL